MTWKRSWWSLGKKISDQEEEIAELYDLQDELEQYTTPVIGTDDTIIAKTNTLLRTTKPLQDGRVNHTRGHEKTPVLRMRGRQ